MVPCNHGSVSCCTRLASMSCRSDAYRAFTMASLLPPRSVRHQRETFLSNNVHVKQLATTPCFTDPRPWAV